MKIFKNFLNFIDTYFVKPVEESKKPLAFWFFLAYAILFIRNFMEMSIEYPGMKILGGFPYPYDTFVTIFIEYPLYGLYIFVLPIFLSLFLKYDIKKITKLVITYLFIIWIPPLFDHYIMKKAFLLTYGQTWDYFYKVVIYFFFIKQPKWTEGGSPGMRIEVWIGIVFVMLYILLKTKDKQWWKSLLYSFLALPVFIFSLIFSGFIPLLSVTIFKFLKMAPSDAKLSYILKEGLIGGHEKTILVFLIFGIPIFLWWFYLANKEGFKEVFRNVKTNWFIFILLPVTVWLVSANIFKQYIPVLFKDPYDYLTLLSVFLVVFTFLLARVRTKFSAPLIFVNFLTSFTLGFSGVLLLIFLWAWEFFWRWIKKPSSIVRVVHQFSILSVLIFIGIVPFTHYRAFWVFSLKFFLLVLLPNILLLLIYLWDIEKNDILFMLTVIYGVVMVVLLALLFNSYLFVLFGIIVLLLLIIKFAGFKSMVLVLSTLIVNFLIFFFITNNEKIKKEMYNVKVVKSVSSLRAGEFYFSRGLNETSGKYFKEALTEFNDIKTKFKYVLTSFPDHIPEDSIINDLEYAALYEENIPVSLALPDIYTFLNKEKNMKNYLYNKIGSSKFGEVFEYKLAQYFRDKGKPDSVFSHSLNSIVRGMDPDLALPLVGEYFLYKERWKKAIDIYLSALDAGAEDSTIYRDLGKCYANLHNYKKAIDWYSKYLKKNQNDSLIMNNVAVLYTRLKRYGEALSIFDRILKNNVKFYDAYINYINLLLIVNRTEEAEEVLSKAFKYFPEDRQLLFIKEQIRRYRYANNSLPS